MKKELNRLSYEILKKHLIRIQASELIHEEKEFMPKTVGEFKYLACKIIEDKKYLIKCLDECFADSLNNPE